MELKSGSIDSREIQPSIPDELKSNIIQGTKNRAMSVSFSDHISVKKAFMPIVKNGGIYIETPNIIPLNSEVLMMITLPDNPDDRSPVVGRVVWITPAENREGYKPAIGIQIISDRSGVFSRIQNIIYGMEDIDNTPFPL